MEVNAGIHVCLVLWEKLNCIDICRNYNFSKMLLLSQSLCCFIGKEIIIAKPTLPWIENTDGGLQNLRIKANSLRMPLQTFIQTMDLPCYSWFSFMVLFYHSCFSLINLFLPIKHSMNYFIFKFLLILFLSFLLIIRKQRPTREHREQV